MSKFVDLYAVVGVALAGTERDPADVSLAEINKAFKKTAKKYHPDKNPLGRERFEAASEAVEVLRDAVRKEKFDEQFRIHQREERRREMEDLRTKRMRQELQQRESEAASLATAAAMGRGRNSAEELERLQRETLQFTQTTRTVLPSRVKHFSMEEHLARERVILKMALQQQQ